MPRVNTICGCPERGPVLERSPRMTAAASTIFRVTAQIQARRRLGLTATLVREDGREEDVFSLIGPKKYDVPWRELETRGWIAEATCTEVRVALPEPLRMDYAVELQVILDVMPAEAGTHDTGPHICGWLHGSPPSRG